MVAVFGIVQSGAVTISHGLVRPLLEQEAHHFHFALEGREGKGERQRDGGWEMTGKGGAAAKTAGRQVIQEGTEKGEGGRVRGKED